MTAKIINKKAVLSDLVINQGEKGSDEIVFTLNKTYNGKDLSACAAFAAIKRADGTCDKIVLTTETDGEQTDGSETTQTLCPDEMTVTLKVDDSVTAVPGELEMQLSFENPDGQVIWETETFVMEIRGSIDAYKDFSERAPDAVTKLHNQMLGYVYRMAELVEEVEAAIEELKNGSGTGGTSQPAYDENNKLSADYVSGLSDVAKTGAYSDLTGTPDMSDYLTSQQVATELNNFKQTLKPVVFKKNESTYSDALYDEINEYNIAIVKSHLASELLSKQIFLYDTVNNSYYAGVYSHGSDTELVFIFYDGTKTYQLKYLYAYSDFLYS